MKIKVHCLTAPSTGPQTPPVWRVSAVFCQVMMALLAGLVPQVWAADYFDPSLLSLSTGSQSTIDLTQFEHPGGQATGQYLVDIYMNNDLYQTRKVNFVRDDASGELMPELTTSQLSDMGVKIDTVKALSGLPAELVLPKALSTYINQAFTKFDFPRMRLNISVPQIYMRPDAANNVNPDLWQEGVPAFILNYNLSGNTTHTTYQGSSNDGQSLFGSFQSGLNLGAWRLRNTSSYSYNQSRFDQYDSESQAKSRESQSDSRWSTQQTYLQRDVIPLRSTLTLGETSTGYVAGQILDGFSYRGFNLTSNDAMLSGYLNTFAPVIKGIAQSNATVTVTQNGAVIYQTNVAPGPFRITDLSGSGTSGDLQVVIKEADGTTHGFRQSFTGLPIMQRTGQLRYELAGGQYYPGHGNYMNTRTPGFGMLTLIYGLPGNVTLYGGGIGAQNYQAGSLGTGFSLGMLGAISLDATHSRAKLDNSEQVLTGESYRARFSKSMLTSGTTVDLTAYRYSTRNFLSFQDANTTGYKSADGLPPWLNERRRSTFEVRLSQRLFDRYSLWLSGHRDNYWGSNRTNTTMSAGLGGATYGVGWGVSYSVDRIRGDGSWPENRQVSLNLNVPLSLFSSRASVSNTYLNYTMTHDSTGRVSNQVSTGGSLNQDGSVSWGASTSQSNQGGGNSGSLSAGYNGSYGQAGIGYNYTGSHSQGITYNASGGILVHPYGVTFGNAMGDSAILVRTPGISGVSVLSGNNVTTDRWGNAVSSSARSYGRNTINIDPSTLPDGALLSQTSNAVYPTAGAVVVTTFPVRTGQQFLMNLSYNGKPVPFGAIATLKGVKGVEADQGSIVGDGGQVYLSGMPEKGMLEVTWGKAQGAQCQAPFDIGPAPKDVKKGEFRALKVVDQACQ